MGGGVSSPSAGLVTMTPGMLPRNRSHGYQRGGSGLRNVSHPYDSPFASIDQAPPSAGADVGEGGGATTSRAESNDERYEGSTSLSRLPMADGKVRIPYS